MLLDYRNDGCRIGLIRAKKVRWAADAGRNGFSALSKTLRVAAGRPSVIGVTVHQRASWSTMRAAVSAANALAFAWNVPVCEVPVTGDENDAQLVALALAAAAQTKVGRWAYPAYGGEPNITVSKKTL